MFCLISSCLLNQKTFCNSPFSPLRSITKYHIHKNLYARCNFLEYCFIRVCLYLFFFLRSSLLRTSQVLINIVGCLFFCSSYFSLLAVCSHLAGELFFLGVIRSLMFYSSSFSLLQRLWFSCTCLLKLQICCGIVLP